MDNAVSRIITQLHEKYRDCRDGNLADYIPELTKANPDWFGISIVTADGQSYSIGDSEQQFTIQSISKAFTYGMILDDRGISAVDQRIGVEPSGEAFNSISLDPLTGRPFNPMINAGAIAATGMVEGEGLEDRFEKIRRAFSRFAGAELEVDTQVCQSESATGFRNRAIANLLRNFEMLDDPVDESVEVYFKQCSILVTCRDLAVMAASLANGGVNPITGEKALKPRNVERVLSVMSTCGMYDYSGEWIFKVGLPAKSGVGGGVLGVLPGQLGVSVFSPLLDPKGNSVRGIKTFAELSKTLNLHLFNAPAVSDYAIRRVYQLNEAGSCRQRPRAHHDAIAEHGGDVTIVELQGELFFSAMERVVRVQSARSQSTTTFVLDLKRVGLIDITTENMLLEVATELTGAGKCLIIVDPSELLDRSRFDCAASQVFFIDEIDAALEHCENLIISERVAAPMVSSLIPFQDFEIFHGLTSAELSIVETHLEMESFPPETRVIEQGAESDLVFLLAKGSVSIFHRASNESTKRHRIAAFGPGVCFGDLAVADQGLRSADVWTDMPCTCYVLALEKITWLQTQEPVIYGKIIRNILFINIDRLRRSNQEIGSLKSLGDRRI